MTVKVEGVEEAQAAIQRAKREMLQGFVRAVEETAEAIAENARSMVPVDTGRLRGSIETIPGGVEASAEYAAYVEFGTSTAPAQPFMLPAAEVERNRFVNRITAEAKEAEREAAI